MLFLKWFVLTNIFTEQEVFKMTLGVLILIVLVVVTISISYKIREHSMKIKELEGGTKKTAGKE